MSYQFLQQDPRFLDQQRNNALNAQRTGYPNGGLQPQQTGFAPMQPQQTGFLQPQQTAAYGMRRPSQPQGFMQPQQPQMTGMPQMMPQQTGYMQQQQQPPSMAPQPTGFAGGGAMPQMTGFRPQQTSTLGIPGGAPPQPQVGMGMQRFTPSPLSAQATGYPGVSAQATGYPGGGYGGGMMPALGASSQPFLNTFMPAPGVQQPNFVGSGFQPSQMQFAQHSQQPLQQTFQQQNQQQVGQAEVRVPWKLNTEEKKSYDQIFRAWDQQGTGFLDGKMAVEVFAQSGLPREEMMAIWCVRRAWTPVYFLTVRGLLRTGVLPTSRIAAS